MSIDRRKLTGVVHDDVLRDEDLADPAVRVEHERLAPRYALIQAVIHARKQRGWTQTTLAEACDTTQSSIARLESGDHDPRWSTAVRVCQVLGIPLTLDSDHKLAG